MTDIQKRGRLIQHDDLRFLADSSCQKDSLALPVTDGIKIPASQFFRMDDPHGLIHFILVFPA